MPQVPTDRIRMGNAAGINPTGQYVLYWMIAARRTEWNFALQRAAELARELNKPLVVFEPLRVGYRWASDRLHQFVIQGMADNARRLAGKRMTYYPYVEPTAGAGRGLLATLAERAVVVVADDYPCFFLPRMVESAARQIRPRLELVDSNGLLPLRAADKVFARAVDFRRFLQKNLRPHLLEFPEADPLAEPLPRPAEVPVEVLRRWPAADVQRLADEPGHLAKLPIDHSVGVAPSRGGSQAAGRLLRQFVDRKLAGYLEFSNHPDEDATSGLSPHLHFGQIAAHEVFAAVMQRDGWSPSKLASKPTGSAQGWWGASEAAEAFFDQLVTWRELGFNMCWQRPDYDQYASLPDWARRTLADHAGDPREFVYALDQLAAADTHDELWNAAQRQLVREGRIHNYLRMLWGKKILQWSRTPQDALAVMIELNDRFALDGRDPNSYSGIFWCLGRYDRAWGPERPIFGKVRYMTSENTARKLRVRAYLDKFGP